MKITGLKKWMLLQLLAVVLTAALLLLYMHMREERGEAYFEDVAVLREIHQLDARWELDVLKSRLGLNTSYDALVNPVEQLHSLPARLVQRAHTAQMTDPARMDEAVSAFVHALDEKSRLIEAFKSHNSVLSNSLSYLPIAAAEISAAANAGQIPVAHAALANRILLSAFALDELPDAKTEMKALLSQLSRLAPPRPGQAEQIQLFIAHGEVVLREGRRVVELLELIAAVPTEKRLDAVHAILNAEQQHVLDHQARHQVMLLVLAGALGLVVIYAARHLARSHVIISQVNQELKHANDTLEERVRERTRELHEMHGKLVGAARQAGMAEVATNVLHNVGNVLNSVSVSAALALERVRQSRLGALGKAAQLMDEHREQLGHFLTQDPRGQRLPAYLQELARTADEERAALQAELTQLGGRVDHIKEIVALQQSNAGAACMYEDCEVSGIVDEALQISAVSLQRHHVTVRKLYEVLPKAEMDRHRVLQILVNLFSNAKRAMSEVEAGQRLLNISLRQSADGRVQIEVADSGEGMTQEVLSRLFTHGFTTRKDGHGFGLHSSALAANEMGGRLSARSAGRGKGATFTLELPFRPMHKEVNNEQADKQTHIAD